MLTRRSEEFTRTSTKQYLAGLNQPADEENVAPVAGENDVLGGPER